MTILTLWTHSSMSLSEAVYFWLAVYAVICTTINLYMLMYKIKLDNMRRKADEREKYKRRIDRENARREFKAAAEELRLTYYDILGGKYNDSEK